MARWRPTPSRLVPVLAGALATALMACTSSCLAGASRCVTSIDDGVACTVDSCDPATGAVSHVADDTRCAADQRCDAAAGCVPVATACTGLTPSPGTQFKGVPFVSGLASPVALSAPNGDGRVFVVEQAGRIRVVKGGVLLATPFLDIVSKVASGGERGLLSVAFHPGYAANGRFFVYYTLAGSGDLRIAEYHADPALDAADSASESPLLTIPHPGQANHNGGQLAFGPDGRLYAGTGDGGGGGDPSGNGQNTAALLGKLLRLDVDAPATPPAGNPFGSAVYHYGLRNPWRFSFDRQTGDLYIGDVGQNAWEELDFAPVGAGGAPAPGVNWGWNVMEGTHCYSPSSGCVTTGLALPIVEVGHPEGVSIIGGYVYRGAVMPDLAATGTYFYGDYLGWARTLRVVGGAATAVQDVTAILGLSGSVSSFGEDGCGELYVVHLGGQVRKIVPGP